MFLFHKTCRDSGTVLLEWLFAIVGSIFLLAILVQLYQTLFSQDLLSRTHFTTLNTLVTAEQTLARRLHLASAWPCGDTPRKVNVLNRSKQFDWLDWHQTHRVHPHNSKTAQSLRASNETASSRVAGSDVITVLNASFPTYLAHHNKKKYTFTLQQKINIERGALAVVCDTNTSMLFQVTRVLDNGYTVAYYNTNTAPGNCPNPWDKKSRCYSLYRHSFSSSSLIAILQPSIWFVGHSHSDGQRSLYWRKLVLANRKGRGVEARMLAEELLPGVALLRGLSLAPNILEVGLVVGIENLSEKILEQKQLKLFEQDVLPWLEPNHFYSLSEFTFSS